MWVRILGIHSIIRTFSILTVGAIFAVLVTSLTVVILHLSIIRASGAITIAPIEITATAVVLTR